MPAEGTPSLRSSTRMRSLAACLPDPALQKPAGGARCRAAGREAPLQGPRGLGSGASPGSSRRPQPPRQGWCAGLAGPRRSEAGAPGRGRPNPCCGPASPGKVPATFLIPGRPPRGEGKRRSGGLGDFRSREGRGPGSLGLEAPRGRCPSTWGNSGRRTCQPGHGNPGRRGNGGPRLARGPALWGAWVAPKSPRKGSEEPEGRGPPSVY